MRQEDIKKLSEPYADSRQPLDRRFHSAIDAAVPSAAKLVREIFTDLDRQSFGVSWWKSVPVEERILIGDYLYQCAEGIETNLVEAKLHYLEWLDVREKLNARIANFQFRTDHGEIKQKYPPAKAPIDDLPNKQEGMHICGFLRAIGSSLDCLAGAIVGVLGLNTSLRKIDISSLEIYLKKLIPLTTPASQIQIDFRDLFAAEKKLSGPEDWLSWTSQYRNMFVHRGRRIMFGELRDSDITLFDGEGRRIPRTKAQLHLAKYPDKSDAEAFIRRDVALNEDADITLAGICDSTRRFEETLSERLLSIWRERRTIPNLIQQPASQWDTKIKPCNFVGYDQNAIPLAAGAIASNPVVFHRMWSAAVLDQHRSVWINSPWNRQ